jgi:hypothetical protein
MFNLIFKIANAATVEEIIQKTINQVVSPFITFLIVLATVIFIWGVIEFIAGADSQEKRITGKKHMIWGILGLFIMLSAAGLMWIIVNFWLSVG